MTDRDRKLIEEGQEAGAIESIVAPFVNEQMRTCVLQLVAMYRQGSINHDMMVGKVAEITALDTLMSTLESKQVRATGAAQREYGGENAKTP